ncbi:MAG TPA: ribosomal protein S18-alanine N-acetyltransferase [Solirubrobacteraceae bacterium]|nr:ribosomal protein S18-alanine N-acetyltransferase [Solirubrobacteraceae bacterium]
MSTVLDVRPLAYADLPQIVAIERRTFSAPWSLSMFVLELSKPDGVCLAARLPVAGVDAAQPGAEGVAGYLICSRYDIVWHVMNVAVDPAHRRHGIASRLLRELLAIVGADARLTLEVRISNEGAIALYEAFGFLAAGVRRRYYADNGEDALIMWRTPATLAGRLDDVPAVGPVPRSELHG